MQRHDMKAPHWRNRGWEYQAAITHWQATAFRERQEERLRQARLNHWRNKTNEQDTENF